MADEINSRDYCFVSYDRDDKQRAAEFLSCLDNYKIPVLGDMQGDWKADKSEIQISRYIAECAAVIVFISENVFKKENSYVRKEYDLAKAFGKTIYIVMLDKIKKEEVPMRLGLWWLEINTIQWIMAYKEQYSECAGKLAGAIRVKLSEKDEKIVYDDGRVYVGEIKNGKAEGKGTLTWPNGSVHEGEFKDGVLNGSGKILRMNGAVCEGEFKDGMLCGSGRIIHITGSVEEGEFKDGMLCGKGRLTDLNGNVFEGEFEKGRLIRAAEVLMSEESAPDEA